MFKLYVNENNQFICVNKATSVVIDGDWSRHHRSGSLIGREQRQLIGLRIIHTHQGGVLIGRRGTLQSVSCFYYHMIPQ